MSAPNIYQVAEEVDKLLDLLSRTPPKTVLEIGIAGGGTLREWSNVATMDAVIIGVDLNTDEQYVSPRCQTIRLLRADSHSPDTLNRVKSILDGKPVDFLFIDGDHSYESVKSDHAMYGPLVKPMGLIAFHDIVPGPRDNVGGVPDYWKEIKGKRPVVEFVKDWNQGGYGIGVIEA